MDTTQELRTLSLCTGYGGIERGLEIAGEQPNVVTHVEIEAFAIANLVAKMEQGELGAAPIWSNLKTLPMEPFRDRIDLLTGGYPCQPFSAAGKRAGTDDPRHLWPYISDIIESVRPVRCFFENVEGHITLGLQDVIEDLERLGYRTTWGIFSAREVGGHHQRKRVYILADSRSAGLQRMCSPRYPSCEGPESNDKQSAGCGTSHSRVWSCEPGVGRVADGSSSRVDRIRLLGNGVVPQTAAKAWLTLNEELL